MYEVAYSGKNQHIFLRASVCCSCGFVGADNEDCGRYGSSNVTITTGPSAWVFVCYESDGCLSHMCWCIFPGNSLFSFLSTNPHPRGQTLPGQCGRCDGVAGVDTLGVYEFDTVSETFVGNHLMPSGVGGDPFSSPDGKFIVLVGRNGGEKLRFLRTGSNGEPSVSSVRSEECTK